MGHVGVRPADVTMTAPRFLVATEALSGDSTVLTGPELHHLRAHRLRVGSELMLANGQGKQRRGILVALERHQAVIRLTNDPPPQRESPLRLILAQALLKADKLDVVIEKATELGVTEVVVFSSERSTRHPSSERQSRWKRVAQSAAKQSQRSSVPRIIGPLTFDQLLTQDTEARRLFFWEECSASAWSSDGTTCAGVLAAVGPEGGFSAAEAQRAADAGMQLRGLAPRILRAETAALVAVTLCQFVWGDLAAHPHPSSSPPAAADTV